jgi:hypothetical protein
MPTLSRFYGIAIKMYFRQVEHNPPHIHAVYGEYVGVFSLEPIEQIEGDLPSKAVKLVNEWISQHQDELIDIWTTQEYKEISPLE